MVAGYAAPQSALDMLRQQGFSQARIELGWGMVDPKTEAQFNNQAVILAFLGRLRKAGLRPLILLNANDGNPCPAISYNVQTTADAPAGARSMTLASTTGLVPGRSGFRHLTTWTAGAILVTEIDGQQVRLSKPLPAAIPAGTTLPFVTLNYEPFSQPGSPRYERTMQGWLRYVGLVCQVAAAASGSAELPGQGFDLEVWNELSFGSLFLDFDYYYDPPPLNYKRSSVYGDIVQRTAAQINAAGQQYHGVRISDGFANTIPWPASSLEPPRVSAMSKHPYPRDLIFPEDEKRVGQRISVGLDALGRPTDFIPAYKCFFPEYFANVIQTESLCREVSPETNIIGGAAHGRLARTVNGQISPVDVWITEIGCISEELGIKEPMQAARQMTLFVLRSVFFHLGIGTERVYLFEAFGSAGSFGLIDQTTPDIPSLPLLCLARVLSAIRGDPKTAGLQTSPKDLTVTVFRGPANQSLFEGNGAPNLPPMTTADGLVLLPIQSSANRIAIIYYVMTRDIRVPLDPQHLKVAIQAENIHDFGLAAYDPITDQYSGIDKESPAPNQVEFEVSATDAPKLLLFTLSS